MPWHKVHTGGKWKVVKDKDGKVVGTHDTEEEANAQLAALYANEKPGRSEFTPPSYPPAKPVSRIHRGEGRRTR